MQLRGGAVAAAVVGLLWSAARPGFAQVGGGVETTTTYFYEQGGPLEMSVINPSASANLDIGEAVSLRAGWDADVVSGASIAVVDAPGGDVDVISSATKLEDTRHVGRGSVEFRGDQSAIRAGYSYGTESDYRSHAIEVSGRTELFERNSIFELAYGRGFDRVCNLAQPRAQEAVDRQPLPGSEGCFVDGSDRESLRLDLHTFQASWTQAWLPVFTTQVTATAQVLDGYQGNPYRAVWLGRTAAQEYHPLTRTRYAVGLAARLWVKPTRGAVQLSGRVYRDSWDVRSVTAEAAYDQEILDGLSLRLRGRYYSQTGAVFFSDDYAREPRGQYFTGDRELSPMSSTTVGGRVRFDLPPNEDGAVLGFLTSLSLVAKLDVVMHDFVDFHYGRAPVPNADAWIGTVGVNVVF